jgi:archaemetzincin
MTIYNDIVHVQPIGYVNARLVRRSFLKVGDYLPLKITILDRILVDFRCYARNRMQYNATQLLQSIAEQSGSIDPDYIKVMGVIDEDLFNPILSYVFGEARLGKHVGIVSLKRFREEYYGRERNTKLMEDRLIKEVLHELGHLYGLVHCQSPRCVMLLSRSIKDVDSKESTFCMSCEKEFYSNLR